jgi:hypothetical protein
VGRANQGFGVNSAAHRLFGDFHDPLPPAGQEPGDQEHTEDGDDELPAEMAHG